jgi:hypothetical protein
LILFINAGHVRACKAALAAFLQAVDDNQLFHQSVRLKPGLS